MADTQTIKTDDFHENRKYKDTLFRLIFNEKESLLELYNALNDTNYTNTNDLTFYTLQDAVYISFKNDVSFLLNDMLNLYEHQSTLNPNMPVRGLIYLARNYSSYINQNHLAVYSDALQKLPFPQYIVFYNGTEDAPEKEVLSLKNAFDEHPDKKPCLECEATFLNINYGKNQELMNRCKKLSDYATFVHLIRSYMDAGLTLGEAAEETINECIQNHVLEKFLLKHRGEVTNVVLSTFDKEVHERAQKEYYESRGIDIGVGIGFQKGEKTKIISLVKNNLSHGKSLSEITDFFDTEENEIRVIAEAIHSHPTANENELYQLIYEQNK